MISRNSSGKPIRIVLDSNLYIAAAGPRSHIAEFIFSNQDAVNPYMIFVSPAILEEVERKLIKKFDYTKPKAIAYIKQILVEAKLIYPTREVDVVKTDKDDNKILECALEAKADMVATADRHLLRLKKFRDIAIVHPSQLKYIFPDIFSA